MIVLNFHRVGDAAVSERALDQDEESYCIGADLFFAVLDQVTARRRMGQAIALTFDDGNRSDVEIGLPALMQRRLTATFFPLAGRIGAPGTVSAEELRALVLAGMSVGSHGHDHVDWRGLDAAGRKREFETARQRIEAAAGVGIVEAAIPFGAYNRAVLADLRRAGFARAYTSDGGAAGAGWIVPRTSIRREMDLAAIEAVLDGREAPLRHVRRRLARLKKRFF